MLTGAMLTAGFYHLYGLVLRDSGHKEMLTDILFYGWLTYRGHPFLLIGDKTCLPNESYLSL